MLVAFSGASTRAWCWPRPCARSGADRVVAATAVSPSLPATERAGRGASPPPSGSGTSSRAPTSSPATDTAPTPATAARFCKAELVDVLTPLAARLGIADVVTGTNADDLRAGFRPGIRAAAERGAWAPLARAGLTKDDVRAAARRWGLPLADKPAAACLASRIAYGVPVSAEGLARVERAEADLRTALTAHRAEGAEPAGARPGRRHRPGGGRRGAGGRPGRAAPTCSRPWPGSTSSRSTPAASAPGR